MMMTRIALSAAVAAASVVLLPTAAMAGEVTGNGKTTGMRGHAASECGFSGREDDPSSPLRTQTPHQVYFFFTVVNPPPGTPGTACNPTKAAGQ